MPTSLPVFYIITPSFNQGQFLTQCIESVLSQTKVKVHLGVFDGGSSDGSVDILKKYGNSIYWVSEKDRGQTHALNKGLEWIEKQEKKIDKEYFFAYLNSDDYYADSESLFAVANSFSQAPSNKWLVGDAQIVDSQGTEIQQPIRMYKRFFRNFIGAETLKFLNPFPQPSTFFRYEALKDIGKFNEKLSYTMDYEYWLRAYKKLGDPVFTSKIISCFRIHSLSKGGTLFTQQFQEEVAVAKAQGVTGWQLLLHEWHAKFTVATYQFLK